jgi:uncharacterized NAD(P)/FAD-binding protein YdhS
MVITIVGGGATALSFLYNFLGLIDAAKATATTVYLVEKRGVFGAGAAYAPDAASNLLNTKTGFITPFHDRPGDFHAWLRANEAGWRLQFPDFVLDEHSYAPRPLFGMYLRKQMAGLVKQALEKNVRIIQVDAEVKDVAQVGASYVTRTDCSLSLTSDYVFLCCGTLPAKSRAPASPAILAHPYPIEELPHKIARDARVAIAGARLSCIDAVIGLVERGHAGPIVIHSRSGHFPSVRGTQGRIVPQLLTAQHLRALGAAKGKLSLGELVQLVGAEIALQSGAGAGAAPAGFTPPAPPADLGAYLRREIALADHPRIWQAVLYSTNAIIDQLWDVLSDADKQVFLEQHFSTFMSYRVSIPQENARKLLAYLESGQLRFQAGPFSVALDNAGKPTVTAADGTVQHYDAVINAVGSPRAISELDSDLLASLLKRGTVAEHRFGGIAIDPVTYQVIDAGGGRTRLFALGELTTGTFFFTSALDINARHARNCAIEFARSLEQRAQAEQRPRHKYAG